MHIAATNQEIVLHKGITTVFSNKKMRKKNMQQEEVVAHKLL